MAEQLHAQLRSKLLPLSPDGAGRTASYCAESAAQRRLHAVALQLLLCAPTVELQSLANAYYEQAVNMTECLAALAALRDVDCAERETVLASFRKQWDGNALVLDKWFALQACSNFGNAAQRVKSLMEDPAFVFSNPNRLRSLIGAFAMNHPRGLHAADGSGYALLADVLPKLDALNPQVSARMAQVLSRWRVLDAARQRMILDLLDSLLLGSLSSDLFEILVKIRGDT
jgi:aminopeptidase N